MKQFTSEKQKIGELGEDQAVLFLMKQGFSIIDRNVSNKFGEIDIVAKKDHIYYFFEVKSGKRGGFINPADNFTPTKVRKCIISIGHYCYTRNISDYRFLGIIVLLSQSVQQSSSVEMIDLN